MKIEIFTTKDTENTEKKSKDGLLSVRSMIFVVEKRSGNA